MIVNLNVATKQLTRIPSQSMFKKLSSVFLKQSKPLQIHVRKGREQTTIECHSGDNLMSVTNSTVNQDVNIFGLCDKQLACTTCRIDIDSHHALLPPPSEEQLDVLLTTHNYQPLTSRMACQITLKEELDGLVVRIEPERIRKSS